MFCLEKTSLHPTLGLHGHGVVSLCLSSWEHPQTAESWKFPFPLCQKDLNAPFRARSSHHIMGQGCPAGTETHFKLRGAQRRSEGSSAPLPSLPRALHCDEATVPKRRPLAARKTQARMAEVTLGRAALSLPCHFTSDTYTTGHPVFKATEPGCPVSKQVKRVR